MYADFVSSPMEAASPPVTRLPQLAALQVPAGLDPWAWLHLASQGLSVLESPPGPLPTPDSRPRRSRSPRGHRLSRGVRSALAAERLCDALSLRFRPVLWSLKAQRCRVPRCPGHTQALLVSNATWARGAMAESRLLAPGLALVWPCATGEAGLVQGSRPLVDSLVPRTEQPQ